MIKFRCNNCNKKIGVPDEYAGKKGKCPKCSAVISIPSQEDEELKASAKTSALIWCLYGATTVFIISALLYVFVFRDTWEIDHYTELSQLISETQIYISEEDPENTIKKYEQLSALIGDRQLKEESLRNDFAYVKTECLELKKIIREEKKRQAELTKIAKEEKKRQAELARIAKKEKRKSAKFPKIDLAWNYIPKGYKGYKIKTVYLRLADKEQEVNLNKSKYESQADFNARLDKAFPFYIAGKEIASNSLMPFKLGQIPARYDAETQKFAVKIAINKDILIYEGMDTKYGLYVNSLKFGRHGLDMTYLNLYLYVKCPKENAEALEDKFGVIYIARPFLVKTSGGGYTMSDVLSMRNVLSVYDFLLLDEYKQSLFWRIYSIVVDLHEIWLYRSDTGRVLAKIR